MANINSIILEGNASKDAIQIGEGNKKFTKFDIAHNHYNSKSGETKTSFFQVLVFGKLAKHAARITSGMPLVIQGSVSIEQNVVNGKNYRNTTIVATNISGIPREEQSATTEQHEYFIDGFFNEDPQTEQKSIDFIGLDESMTP